jgi:hypothetical protein
LTFVKSDHNADRLLLRVLLHLLHAHLTREETAIKVEFLEAQEIGIQGWRIIRFPAPPRGEQRTLLRGHDFAQRTAAEMGVPRKSNLPYLWKDLCILRLRHCWLT